MVTKTPENVARLATTSDVLKTGQLALIGLFGPEDALQAMIRMPSGRIRQVELGARLSAGRVVGIDRKGLLLEKHGATRRLPLLTQ